MYGLNSATNLSFFVNRELLQVAIGVHESILYFDGTISLTFESRCRVNGSEYAAGIESGPVLFPFLGRVVNGVEALESRHLALVFDHGEILVVVEDDGPYESFTISTPSETIVV